MDNCGPFKTTQVGPRAKRERMLEYEFIKISMVFSPTLCKFNWEASGNEVVFQVVVDMGFPLEKKKKVFQPTDY